MKHVLLQNQWLEGWEYGILRSLEKQIIETLDADIVNYPIHRLSEKILHHFGQGMSKGKYREFLPKTKFAPEADVLWIVLMGPETYLLDLYEGWQKSARKKVVYLCDTLPHQMPMIKRLFSSNKIDYCITAFNDAVPFLEKFTKRKWYSVLQAAPWQLFSPIPFEQRVVHFSAYGRRHSNFHEALIEFCNANSLFYDYTTHDGRHPTAGPLELYKQYAWHIQHSMFTVSWPVELTNPQRAGYLNPITPRWFEGALAGTPIIGKSPNNDLFNEALCKELVIDIDPKSTRKEFLITLDKIWSNRKALLEKATELQIINKARWDWSDRLTQINKIINGFE